METDNQKEPHEAKKIFHAARGESGEYILVLYDQGGEPQEALVWPSGFRGRSECLAEAAILMRES